MKTSLMRKIGTLSAGALLALGLAACQRQEAAGTGPEPAADQTTAAPQDQMPAATEAPPAAAPATEGQTFNASGTVTAVDPATGRVSIQHEAVTDANIAAGTTEFEVQNRDTLNQINTGQQVDFTFMQQPSGQPAITQIMPSAGQSPQPPSQ